MKAKRIMRRDFQKVNPDFPLKKIEDLMKNAKTQHVLVIENDRLLGIISDRDVKTWKSVYAGTQASNQRDELTLNMKAHQIMTRDPISVPKNTALTDVIDVFMKKNIHSLPVLDEDDRVVGIITERELLRLLDKIAEVFHS